MPDRSRRRALQSVAVASAVGPPAHTGARTASTDRVQSTDGGDAK